MDPIELSNCATFFVDFLVLGVPGRADAAKIILLECNGEPIKMDYEHSTVTAKITVPASSRYGASDTVPQQSPKTQ